MKRPSTKTGFTALANMYAPNFYTELVYMLQASEYSPGEYIKWFWRSRDVGKVMYRRKLVYTPVAISLLVLAWLLGLVQFIFISVLVGGSISGLRDGFQFLAFALFLAQPIITAHIMALPVVLGKLFIVAPMNMIRVDKAKHIFAATNAKKIVVAGSYGKTTMKEILGIVLASEKNVAMTPGNMNTTAGHARFAAKLTGKEDILILELGEYEIGDVAKYCHTIQPDYGVITGLAPAHLHNFGTLEKAGENIFGVADYVDSNHLYINDENETLKPFVKKDFNRFSRTATLGWSIAHVKTSLEGTSFTMQKGKKILKLKSGLVGNHMVGPLAFAAAFAIEEFGFSKKSVEAAIARTKPFEHRLQPTKLPTGAWLIDDTYNGNIEGVRAAVMLLKEVKTKRRIYVTPGLVEQGIENVSVHNQLGELIADAVDEVVLMRNSTTPLIEAGLTNANYKGVLRKIDEPLKFYESIPYLVSAGDVILLQNDWTDNYY